MTAAPIPRISLRTPSDVIQAVPYVMGFQPRESVVIMLLEELEPGREKVKLTARFDLNDPPAMDGLLPHAEGCAALIVAFSDQSTPRQVENLLRPYVAALDVRDVLITDGTEFWGPQCTSYCCETDLSGPGQPVASDRVAAEMVSHGFAPATSREALEASLVPGQHVVPLRATHALLGSLPYEVWAEYAVQVVSKLVAERITSPGDEATAMLVVVAGDILVRDALMASFTAEDAREYAALWAHVVRSSSDESSAGPLALYGVATYLRGDGAGLNVAVNLLRARHPDYAMGRLLAQIAEAAVPPETLMAALKAAGAEL